MPGPCDRMADCRAAQVGQRVGPNCWPGPTICRSCCPAHARSHHATGAAELVQINRGDLVSLARGGIVDDAALALGAAAAAAVIPASTMFEGEAARPSRPAAVPNVVLTPHISAPAALIADLGDNPDRLSAAAGR